MGWLQGILGGVIGAEALSLIKGVCFNLGANQAATAESSGRGGVQFRRGHTWPV